ncbi:MAG: hypothetical protein WC375_04285 [Methanomassiliicoccales archaeon]
MGSWGNNLSLQRKYIPLIGEWERFYGYGEEDQYWDFRAIKNGMICLRSQFGKDLYVCHINHDRGINYDFSVINRLYLFEMHPEFEKHIIEYNDKYNMSEHDDAIIDVNRFRANGLKSSPIYKHLPPLPDCLKKYEK